jgi:hypothetical protein
MSFKPIEDLDVSYVSVLADLAKFTVMVLSLQANTATWTISFEKESISLLFRVSMLNSSMEWTNQPDCLLSQYHTYMPLLVNP